MHLVFRPWLHFWVEEYSLVLKGFSKWEKWVRISFWLRSLKLKWCFLKWSSKEFAMAYHFFFLKKIKVGQTSDSWAKCLRLNVWPYLECDKTNFKRHKPISQISFLSKFISQNDFWAHLSLNHPRFEDLSLFSRI